MIDPALTACSDPMREIPRGLGERLDQIDAALASLTDEHRRLRRLGFEAPLGRCHEALRFWTFLRGLHGVLASEGAAFLRDPMREPAWDDSES